MNLICVHLYRPADRQANRRCYHIRLRCLAQFVAAGFIRAPQQHRCPLRTCQVIHSSGSGRGLAGCFFSCIFTAAWQPSGLHHNPIPSEMMSLLVRLCGGYGRFGAILNAFVTLHHVSINIAIGLMALSVAMIF